MYKEELQRKNEEKLHKRFQQDNAPMFIRKYFVNIESKAGALNYYGVIKDLLEWLMEEKVINKTDISEITPDDFYIVESEDVTMYLRQREQDGLSPTTLEVRKNIYSSFWRYLKRTKACPVKDNIIADVSYRGISINNNLYKKLPTETQLKNMEVKIKRTVNDFTRIRNMIIFRVLKGSGIRETELAGLNVDDVFLDNEMPYIKILGKGKYREQEVRQVYLTKDASDALSEWIEYRNNLKNVKAQEALFLNNRGNRLTEHNIQSIFKMYGDGISCHMLRHWYATIMTQAGGIAFAQQQLGHTSLNTTINNYANGSYGMKDLLASM